MFHEPPKKTIFMISLWLFNIAMENPIVNGGFLAGKIICKWTIFHMLNKPRVVVEPVDQSTGACLSCQRVTSDQPAAASKSNPVH